ncbi:helix-turn-helix transcriptional regulator [Streptomyces meridianus]|uniref:Helix-turn-helix domain-containing protein n=1 Tax=Streptomyces meridianus TaxID=2938945 RepID=A0ABT0X9E0_9ACTN|nr:helix-turn-helix domain-containing protein [Streptomyces meridianus]MCM2578389.1 helix-turn-helix domain-containing protein [Streptomyces meridianus]
MGTSRERSRRREVLDLVQGAGAPVGVAEVAEHLGVHANTARSHLDALLAEGSVERTLERPSGPGRPRTVYTPRPGMDRDGPRSYLLLAQVLLGHLASGGEDAGEAAARAGRAWGRHLMDSPPPFRHLTDGAAIARLTALLDDLGFAPQSVGDDAERPDAIRLRHCPFLELAEDYGPLVCQVHLGLMQGSLTELGTTITAARLEPFAEPDACLARLERADAA